MKPILVEISDISDSREVYESRPNPFFTLFMYLLLLILAAALIWTAFFKLDIVVKGTGYITAKEDSPIVTNTYAGIVTKCNIVDGQTVAKGDVLYEVEAKNWDLQLDNYNSQLEQNENRLVMMEAYLSWLSDNSVDLSAYSDNPYYEEYAARQKIAALQMDLAESEFSAQDEVYDAQTASKSNMIDFYGEEIDKLNQLSVGIRTRVNTFAETDSYYWAKLNNYITQYNNIVAQYDTTLSSLQRELEQAEQDLNEANSDITDADEKIEQAQNEIDNAKREIAQSQFTKINIQSVTMKTAMSGGRKIIYRMLSEDEPLETYSPLEIDLDLEEEETESEESEETEAASKENKKSEEESKSEKEKEEQTETAPTQEKITNSAADESAVPPVTNIMQETPSEYKENIITQQQGIQITDISKYETIIAEKQAEIASAKTEKLSAETAKKTYEATIRAKQDAITSTTLEKKTSLSNLETETIASVETSILQYRQNILSTNGSRSEVQIAQNSMLEQGTQNNKENIIQTEIQTISAEISACNQKKQELDANIMEAENGKCNTVIKAPISGTINLTEDLVVGNYLPMGGAVMTIIPQKEDSFLVRSYIDNQDIARIHPELEVKYEIAAYPSNEYGVMTGNVEFVSADLRTDNEKGSAYYIVETSIDDTQLYNKEGEKLNLKVGMYCETKIIVERKSVLRFLLEKIHLMD